MEDPMFPYSDEEFLGFSSTIDNFIPNIEEDYEGHSFEQVLTIFCEEGYLAPIIEAIKECVDVQKYDSYTSSLLQPCVRKSEFEKRSKALENEDPSFSRVIEDLMSNYEQVLGKIDSAKKKLAQEIKGGIPCQSLDKDDVNLLLCFVWGIGNYVSRFQELEDNLNTRMESLLDEMEKDKETFVEKKIKEYVSEWFWENLNSEKMNQKTAISLAAELGCRVDTVEEILKSLKAETTKMASIGEIDPPYWT